MRNLVLDLVVNCENCIQVRVMSLEQIDLCIIGVVVCCMWL